MNLSSITVQYFASYPGHQ